MLPDDYWDKRFEEKQAKTKEKAKKKLAKQRKTREQKRNKRMTKQIGGIVTWHMRHPNWRKDGFCIVKLSPKDVMEIRANTLGLTRKQLSEQYGVSMSTISHVITGKTWKEIA